MSSSTNSRVSAGFRFFLTSSTDSDPAPESTEGDRLGALQYVANRVQGSCGLCRHGVLSCHN